MTTINITIPQSVLDAALALHRKRNSDLSYESIDLSAPTAVEITSLWKCAGQCIEFVNLEARNHCTAVAFFQQVTPSISIDGLFNSAHELWKDEISHPDMASGRFLGLASQNFNILVEAAKIIQNKNQAIGVFQILHLIKAALPHLPKIIAEDLIAVVDAQHEFTKHDMAAGLLFNAIERRLSTESHLAWDIWRLTKENMSESMQSLYSAALQALMHTDQQSLALEKAWEDSDHMNPMIAGNALWTLGRAIQVHSLNGSDADKCAAILISKVDTSPIEVQQIAIRAIAHAALKNDRLMSELVRLAVEPSDYTLAVVADFLFMNHRDWPASSPYFKALLNTLIKITPSHKGAIDNFDWVLHQLYETPENRPAVLNCLTQWIIQHGETNFNNKDSVELFDQTFMRIANDNSGLQTIITRWLTAPEKQLAVACGGLISYLHIRGIKSPTFSPEVLNTFESQDFKFLARRLLGYVLSEDPLLSLTLSLLQVKDAPARSFGWVFSLLTEEIGRDYAYATMEALKTRQKAVVSPEKELLQQVHSILLQRSIANDDLPKLQEIRPPVRLRRAIALHQARQMEQARDNADEKSIVRTLFAKVPLKSGMGYFSVLNNKVGPTNNLQSFSYSATLPKRSITDPAGYAIAGLLFRISKRDDE